MVKTAALVRAAVLAPTVFVLAIAAAFLGATAVPWSLVSGDRAPGPPALQPALQGIPPGEPDLSITVTVPAAGEGAPLALLVRITTAPPVPRAVLQARTGYLTDLLQSLVRQLPAEWRPDPPGMATLQRAIADTVADSIGPSLPPGTRLTIAIGPAGSPPPPAPP
jgi:hypothetical protein